MSSAPRGWMLLAILASSLLIVSGVRAARHRQNAPTCTIAVEDEASARPQATTDAPLVVRSAASAAPAEDERLTELEHALSQAPDAELSVFAGRIAARGGEDAVRALARWASSPRPGLRAAVLTALATLDSEPARAFMLSALASENAPAAIEYFKNCVDSRAVPALERLARQSGTELGTAAVEALVAQGPSAHVNLMRLAQSDADAAPAVFSAASNVLSLRPALRNVAIARLQRGMRVPSEIIAYLAADRSTEALAALSAAAREPALTELAVEALSNRGDPESAARLLALQRAEPPVACEARHALWSQIDSRSLAWLSRLGGSTHSAQAMRALLQVGAPEGSRSLRALLASVEPSERSLAIGLLPEFGPVDTQRLLMELLRDPAPRVKFESGMALGRLGVVVEGMPSMRPHRF